MKKNILISINVISKVIYNIILLLDEKRLSDFRCKEKKYLFDQKFTDESNNCFHSDEINILCRLYKNRLYLSRNYIKFLIKDQENLSDEKLYENSILFKVYLDLIADQIEVYSLNEKSNINFHFSPELSRFKAKEENEENSDVYIPIKFETNECKIFLY